ncbi:MAG TPA: YfbM family protein [Povalibacter sp.]|nr:YfbM family protein [Povalibacter sp.]
MGMYLSMCTLSDDSIGRVLSDPPLVWKVISPDDAEPYEEARSEMGLAEPQVAFELADGEVVETHLDKTWHGIHYMLTQSAWEGDAPLNFLLAGGIEVGDLEVGYGAARVFSSEQVTGIAGALQRLDESFLRSRFNPDEMMSLEIYPTIWDRDPKEDDPFGYCAEYFVELKSFVRRAAERKTGLLIHLS